MSRVGGGGKERNEYQIPTTTIASRERRQEAELKRTFSTGSLDEILDSINQTQSAIGVPLPYVSS